MSEPKIIKHKIVDGFEYKQNTSVLCEFCVTMNASPLCFKLVPFGDRCTGSWNKVRTQY